MPAICRHFGVCGGCQTQDVPYPEQLAAKRWRLQQLLREAVGRRAPAVAPVVGMRAGADGMPRHFRHKSAFVFAPGGPRGLDLVMGHYAARSHRVVPVSECPVHSERANRLAFGLRDHLARARIPAAGRGLDGILGHVVIRTSHDDREALVMLVVTRNDKSLRRPLRAFLASDDRPDGLLVSIHDRDDPFMIGDTVLRIDGRAHVRETRIGPAFLVSATGFFQTNPEAAAALVSEVVARVRQPPGAAEPLRVLDLYAGSGLFAVPLALAGHGVTAVEESRQSVKDGAANAALNRIPAGRLTFVASRAEDYLRRTARAFDVAVLDPPRQGCSPEVIGSVFGDLKPGRVVYVSCQPEAFVRELPWMLEAGYRVERIQPVDMFPHTDHVELVAALERARASR